MVNNAPIAAKVEIVDKHSKLKNEFEMLQKIQNTGLSAVCGVLFDAPSFTCYFLMSLAVQLAFLKSIVIRRCLILFMAAIMYSSWKSWECQLKPSYNRMIYHIKRKSVIYYCFHFKQFNDYKMFIHTILSTTILNPLIFYWDLITVTCYILLISVYQPYTRTMVYIFYIRMELRIVELQGINRFITSLE